LSTNNEHNLNFIQKGIGGGGGGGRINPNSVFGCTAYCSELLLKDSFCFFTVHLLTITVAFASKPDAQIIVSSEMPLCCELLTVVPGKRKLYIRYPERYRAKRVTLFAALKEKEF
jgi:hypothetical protein